MIAFKFWFNVGQRSWTTGRVFQAGFASRSFRHRKVKFKMVREKGIHCSFLQEIVLGSSQMPLD
jgi:hypothetical protein